MVIALPKDALRIQVNKDQFSKNIFKKHSCFIESMGTTLDSMFDSFSFQTMNYENNAWIMSFQTVNIKHIEDLTQIQVIHLKGLRTEYIDI